MVADSVQPEHSAALRPAHQEPRSADPDPVLEGISTGDFEEALGALLGKDAGGCRPRLLRA